MPAEARFEPVIPESAPPETVDPFLRDVQAMATRILPAGWELRVRREGIEIREAGDGEGRVIPGLWLYKVYCAAENRLDSGLAVAAAELVERVREKVTIPPNPGPEHASIVYPYLEPDPSRDPGYDADDDDMDLYMPWVYPLRMVWALQYERNRPIWLQRWAMEDMGLNLEGLAKRAMANLSMVRPNLVLFDQESGDERYGIVGFYGGADPMLNSSLVLCPKHMMLLAETVGCDDLLVAVPTNYMTIACANTGATAAAKIGALARVVHRTSAHDLVSTAPFHWKAGTWDLLTGADAQGKGL